MAVSRFSNLMTAAVLFPLAACAVGGRYGDPDYAIGRQISSIESYQTGRGNVAECLKATEMLAEWSVNGGETSSINAARRTGGCDANPSFPLDVRNAIALGAFSSTGNSSADDLSRGALVLAKVGLENRYQQLLARGPAR